MEQLIEILERKNLCFKSFHKICSDFLDEISKGDVSKIEEFQNRRQGLINVLEHLESDISQWLKENPPEEICEESKGRISLLLTEKDGLVRSILDLDLVILSHIDKIKDETIQKLQSVQSGKKTISAYRSPIGEVESVEVRKALDREA